MSESMRATLRRATTGPGKVTVAIISGRAREKVEAFVQLDGVFYALLPKGGLDPAAVAAARSKEAGEARMAALNEAAAGAPDNIEAAQGAASEISNMFGFGGS